MHIYVQFTSTETENANKNARERERERERENERDLKCAFIIERPIYAQKTAANFFVTCCILYKMGMITV